MNFLDLSRQADLSLVKGCRVIAIRTESSLSAASKLLISTLSCSKFLNYYVSKIFSVKCRLQNVLRQCLKTNVEDVWGRLVRIGFSDVYGNIFEAFTRVMIVGLSEAKADNLFRIELSKSENL